MRQPLEYTSATVLLLHAAEKTCYTIALLWFFSVELHRLIRCLGLNHSHLSLSLSAKSDTTVQQQQSNHQGRCLTRTTISAISIINITPRYTATTEGSPTWDKRTCRWIILRRWQGGQRRLEELLVSTKPHLRRWGRKREEEEDKQHRTRGRGERDLLTSFHLSQR